MIPMTVSYFLKQSKNKTNGISKCINIWYIYNNYIRIALGVGVSAFGPEVLNSMVLTPILILLFFIFL